MIDQLGYLAFEVEDLDLWESFATEVLGLAVARRWDGGRSLRMDGHAQRFFLHAGPAEDLVAVGWQVAGEAALEAVVARLRAAGYAVDEAPAAETAARQVVRLFSTRDPAGLRVELFIGPAMADAPFVSPVVKTGFVADEHGLGHLVLSSPDDTATGGFYRDLLGFRLSDRVCCEFYGHPVDITFLHTNPRHHSLAFGGPQPKRLHHFLLETRSVDDVGMALDRAVRGGVRIAQMLGRHANDEMLSFYAFTPSGFQFEFGCGGRLIDQGAWTPTVHDRVSQWGHHPPERYAPRRPKP